MDAVPSEDPAPTSQARLSQAIRRAGLIAWSLVGVLVVLWLLVWILGWFEVLLAPVVVAVVVVYLLNPVVGRFAKMRIPRAIGTLLAYAISLGAVVLVGFLLLPKISDQTRTLAADFPVIYEDSASEVEQIIAQAGFEDVDLWSYAELQTFIKDPSQKDAFLSAVFENIAQVTSGILEAVLVFFVAPVVAFYILIDLPRVRREAVALIPLDLRDEIVYVTRQIGGAVGGFLRGQVLVALIVGALMSAGFWLIDLRFWLIIGMLSGFFNIVPFVGPWVGGFLGVLVGLTSDLQTAVLAAIVALVVQQIDNNFVSPTVLRATVRLHPAVVLLVLIFGGAVGGVWGVLLAVPLTAGGKIMCSHIWRTRVLGQSWEEASGAITTKTESSLAKLRRETGAFAVRTDKAQKKCPTDENEGTDGSSSSLNG